MRSSRSGAVVAATSAAVLGLAGIAVTASPAAAFTRNVEFKSVESNFGLIMSAAGNFSGARVGVAADNNGSTQRWIQVGNDSVANYMLAASEFTPVGQCLDIENDSKAVDANIVVRPCDGTASQKWTLTQGRLLNRYSALYVQLPSGPEFNVTLKQTTVPEADTPLSIKWIKSV
ncbi:RICIN domain-containing protein [Micromonospora sp. NPDC051141]|uniref:RICIN domain-containing protein n=1 Tax=Micromonospora sp. NPDC051141 TaxID=3364284 RepID=UPI0037A4C233